MRFVLFLVVLAVMIPAVSSSYDLDRYYGFDEDVIDVVNGANGTLNGTVGYDTGVYKLGNASIQCDGNTANFVNLVDYTDWDTDWSVEYWINPDTLGSHAMPLASGSSAGNRIQFGIQNTEKIWFYAEQTGSVNLLGNSVIYVGNWYHVVFVRTGNNFTIYLDGVEDASVIAAITVNASNNLYACRSSWAVGDPYTGELDEIAIYPNALTPAEVLNLYNNPEQYPYSYDAPTVSFVDPTPVDGDVDNVQVTFNMSCTFADKYYLWLDNSSTPSTLVLDNSSVSYYDSSFSISDTYYYKAACFNSTADTWGANSSIRNVTYDLEDPTSSFLGGNEFNVNNFSLKNQYDDTLLLNMSFFDNYDLFALDINISRGGVDYYNRSNISISGVEYNFSDSIDVSGWGEGVYNVEVLVADSHTAKFIDDYDVVSKRSELLFDTVEGNKIKVSSVDDSSTSVVKRLDRYEFGFDFSDKLVKDRVFEVEADNLFYRPDSGFKGHFVVWNGVGGNWIDFEGVDGVPVVRKVNSSLWTVTFRDVVDAVEFKSIGGLNVVYANYSWYRGNYSFNVPVGLYEVNSSFNLNLSNGVGVDVVSVKFFWNGSEYGVSELFDASSFGFVSSVNMSVVGVDIDAYWLINVSQEDGNWSEFSVGVDNNVSVWLVDNCSVGTDVMINFNIFNEQSPSNGLVSDVAVAVDYWYDDYSPVYNFTGLFSGSDSYDLCISPSGIELFGNLYFLYNVSDGFTHRYYMFNQSLSDVVLNVSMFNVGNVSGYSDLSITARDKNTYGYYVGTLGKLQRRYVSEGVWRTVQMDLSGDYGQLFYNVIEENTDYRIIFTDTQNNVLDTTNSLKFICTSGLCSVTYLLTPYATISDTTGLDVSYEFNNDTGLINVSWDDPLGRSDVVNTRVVKESGSGSLLLCDSTTSASSGSHLCNISGHTGLISVKVNSSINGVAGYDSNNLFTVSPTKLGNLLGAASSAIWGFMIVGVVFMFGLISPATSIIAVVFGLIGVWYLGIAPFITTTFVILAAIIGIVVGLKVRA